MTNEFIREARYVVLKSADVMKCLTVSELIELRRIQAKVEEHRAEIGKPPLDCVVVESDWPEYEPTWRAIEARVTGAQPAPSFADAYQGAMEEVAIWKKRALEAEDLNRKFVAEINGPTYMGGPAQPAPSVPERITHDQAPHVYSQEAAEGYADGWNACVKKIVAAAPQNCIKAAMEAQREGCAEIVLQAAHKAADCNNLRDYELLRALSIEVAKAPEAKP